jgi:uncharacterized protein
MQDLSSTIRRLALQQFKTARGSHDWDHTLRVHRLCRKIGAKEKADMDVLSVSAYLHDIGRSAEDHAKGAVCHAEKGAHMAETLIRHLPLSPAQKENVIHCIRTHRYRGNNIPETIEARVLFDADKIDAIGAIGVARAFLFAGEVGAKLHNPDAVIENTTAYSIDDTAYREYKIKLSKIINRIMTAEGKRIAQKRHDFMELFFHQFLQEFEGKREHTHEHHRGE